MLRKQAGKSGKEKSTTSSTTRSSTTAARLADYTGAQSAPLAGYGITTVPGLYHTMSQSPGSPGYEGGATGGFSTLDATEDVASGVAELGIHHKETKEVRVNIVPRSTSYGYVHTTCYYTYSTARRPVRILFISVILAYKAACIHNYFAASQCFFYRRRTVYCRRVLVIPSPASRCLLSFLENRQKLYQPKALNESRKL